MAEGRAQLKTSSDVVERQAEIGCLEHTEIAKRNSPSAIPWEGDHPINIRICIPLLSKRYYVTLIAGEERRSPDRLAAERARHPLLTRGNIILFAALGTVLGLAGFALIQFAMVYLLDQAGAFVS